MDAARLDRAARATREHWQHCEDTHVAGAVYYQRVRSVLPLLCELHVAVTDRVLDVGCGDGEFSETIARRCAVLEGIDLSAALVARAMARGLTNAWFVAAGTDALADLPDRSYDVAVAMGLFATLHGDAFDRTLDDLARLLPAGGRLITRDSVRDGPDLVRQVKDGYHAHYRNADGFVEAFTKRGLHLRRAVFLDAFDDLENYFFVFERV